MIENNLDVGGAVVFWSIAEWTDRSRLAEQLTALQLEALVPDLRPAPAALRVALDEVLGGPRMLIRPLGSKDGFAVVQEDRGVAANQYQTLFTSRVQGDPPTLSFDPWDSRAIAVESAYRTQLDRVSAMQVSAVLVRVVESLGGVLVCVRVAQSTGYRAIRSMTSPRPLERLKSRPVANLLACTFCVINSIPTRSVLYAMLWCQR